MRIFKIGKAINKAISKKNLNNNSDNGIKIHRYPMPDYYSKLEIELPEGSIFLHADFQLDGSYSELQLWFLINTKNKTEKRFFKVIATDEKIKNLNSIRYLTTINGDPYIWHIFEIGLYGMNTESNNDMHTNSLVTIPQRTKG